MRFDFVPAHHWSKRTLTDTCRTLWGGWVLTDPDGRRVYFAGDTGYGHWFTRIGRRYPGIDLALMPVGAYDPRWWLRDVHCDPEEAVRAVEDLGARRMAPMHWGDVRALRRAGPGTPHPGADGLGEGGPGPRGPVGPAGGGRRGSWRATRPERGARGTARSAPSARRSPAGRSLPRPEALPRPAVSAACGSPAARSFPVACGSPAARSLRGPQLSCGLWFSCGPQSPRPAVLLWPAVLLRPVVLLWPAVSAARSSPAACGSPVACGSPAARRSSRSP
ncbi:hypothetical protein GCM10020295_14080 [Streptomyces cinereospinus]